MSSATEAAHVALDLTYVLYDEASHLAHALALLTLSPILLCLMSRKPAYLALALYTRELLFFELGAGQLLCEAFNYFLKHIIKEERPNLDLGEGYGFPSSHSQWMGYFAAFMTCHFIFRHRFPTTGIRVLDVAWKATVHSAIALWAAAVATSRYYLSYHTIPQVLWGLAIGIAFGATYYSVVELIPVWWPSSLLGQARILLLSNPVSTWFRLRDGWAVWHDGGIETQWLRWREEWDRQRRDQDRKRR
ncbi:PAP2-domain-containing protein [Obba rivulosa]|uniref:PAP2-domain-containing protein n=1 Tax=Obba rivulosa TaxID=1052685 RepID=A0A8E2AV06_9APHY|nr:PAP2-domain-containing protein [Obba rivulosa]